MKVSVSSINNNINSNDKIIVCNCDFEIFVVDPDVLSQRTYRSNLSVNEAINSGNRDFKILVENKSNARHCIHLVAPTVQDKEAWISDISQCIDNIHLHTMMSPTTESIGLSSLTITRFSQCKLLCVIRKKNSIEASSIGPQLSLHSDPRLFTDDIDIRFSRTLNSCKLPQVRYATPERLLQRLTGSNTNYIDFYIESIKFYDPKRN